MFEKYLENFWVEPTKNMSPDAGVLSFTEVSCITLGESINQHFSLKSASPDLCFSTVLKIYGENNLSYILVLAWFLA